MFEVQGKFNFLSKKKKNTKKLFLFYFSTIVKLPNTFIDAITIKRCLQQIVLPLLLQYPVLFA